MVSSQGITEEEQKTRDTDIDEDEPDEPDEGQRETAETAEEILTTGTKPENVEIPPDGTQEAEFFSARAKMDPSDTLTKSAKNMGNQKMTQQTRASMWGNPAMFIDNNVVDRGGLSNGLVGSFSSNKSITYVLQGAKRQEQEEKAVRSGHVAPMRAIFETPKRHRTVKPQHPNFKEVDSSNIVSIGQNITGGIATRNEQAKEEIFTRRKK